MRGIRATLASSAHRVSAGGRFFYTERQLYYEVCRSLRPVTRYGRGIPFCWPKPISYAEFSQALKVHVSLNGTPPMLLPEVTPCKPGFLAHEKDLADYGIPRLLVCADRNIAAMIIANHMHMELCCPALGLSDASPLPDLMCALLARTEEPRVYLLHDADMEGLTLFMRLRARLSLPATVTPVEVGLRPYQAAKTHLFVERTGLPAEDWHLPVGFTPFEKWWVKTGLKAEVAALSPVSLFRMLRKALLLGN